MSAVSPKLLKTIQELQALPSLSGFSLGGGTNLALQYNHRISDDIDLFCPTIVGRAGFKQIEHEVSSFYRDKAFGFQDPCGISDQYSFLRFFIIVGDGLVIKVEVLQNMKNLYKIESQENVRLLSKKDIGLFKLISASNRSTKKDIYDLDFITNDIPLIELYEALKIKMEKFSTETDLTIFDKEGQLSLINSPELLLKYNEVQPVVNDNMPIHGNDNIIVFDGSKSWLESQMTWRTKVRRLYDHLGKDFPKPQGVAIK